eukprot:Opistho-2@83371
MAYINCQSVTGMVLLLICVGMMIALQVYDYVYVFKRLPRYNSAGTNVTYIDVYFGFWETCFAAHNKGFGLCILYDPTDKDTYEVVQQSNIEQTQNAGRAGIAIADACLLASIFAAIVGIATFHRVRGFRAAAALVGIASTTEIVAIGTWFGASFESFDLIRQKIADNYKGSNRAAVTADLDGASNEMGASFALLVCAAAIGIVVGIIFNRASRAPSDEGSVRREFDDQSTSQGVLMYERE